MNFYELLLAKQLAGGGGGSAVINPLSVSANGTYSAPEGVDGYNPVEVTVPMPSGTYSIGANGDYDIASYASAHVSVPTGVFPSGTSNITSNGVYDVTNYASASVNVSGGGGTDTRFKDLVEREIRDTIEDSTVSRVGNYAFYWCPGLKNVSFPNATTISPNAFYSCTNLLTASLATATNIGSSAFYSDNNIEEIYCPNVETLGANCFALCSHLETITGDNISYIGAAAFSGCNSLATISLPKMGTIASSAFKNCYHLLTLYLMGSDIATLLNSSNCFVSTPIGGYTGSTGGVYGSIFVPSSLYSQYIAANNWSNYAARFVSV